MRKKLFAIVGALVTGGLAIIATSISQPASAAIN
jgi:hypothetical protein